MLKGLQAELKKIEGELKLWIEMDAPEKDIKDLKSKRDRLLADIMKICRGEY